MLVERDLLDLGGDVGSVLVVNVHAVKLSQDLDVVIYVSYRIRQEFSFDGYVSLTNPSDDKFHHLVVDLQGLSYMFVI